MLAVIVRRSPVGPEVSVVSAGSRLVVEPPPLVLCAAVRLLADPPHHDDSAYGRPHDKEQLPAGGDESDTQHDRHPREDRVLSGETLQIHRDGVARRSPFETQTRQDHSLAVRGANGCS